MCIVYLVHIWIFITSCNRLLRHYNFSSVMSSGISQFDWNSLMHNCFLYHYRAGMSKTNVQEDELFPVGGNWKWLYTYHNDVKNKTKH
jgi:hypothetical protein